MSPGREGARMPKRNKKIGRTSKPNNSSGVMRRAVPLLGVVVVVAVVARHLLVPASSPRQPAEVTSGADQPKRPPYVIPPRPEFAQQEDSTEYAQISAMRDESFEVAEQVVASMPASPDAVCLLGTVHHRHGNDEAAMRLWQACLELDEDFADAPQMLGTTAADRGDYAAAERYLRLAQQADPDWPAISLPLAEALQRQGKFAEAVEVLEHHCQKHPQDALARCGLGEAQQQMERYELARQSFQEALDHHPKSADALYGLATVCRLLGDVSAAESYLDRFRGLHSIREQVSQQLRPNFDDAWRMRTTLVNTHMTAARIYLRHGKASDAQRHARRAAALDPQHVASRQVLCQMYSARHDPQSALPLRRELCKLVPDDPHQWLQRGILSYQLGNLEEAERAFRQLIEIAPQQAEGYLTLAQILMQPDKDPQEAVALARRGIELAPTAPNYHILAAVQQQVGNIAGAREALARAMQLDPRNPKYQQAYQRLQRNESP